MSTSWTNAMWQLDITPAARKLVALAVADCHNVARQQCNPGIEYIAEKCAMSEGQVRRHLVDLCEAGVFVRERARRADGSLGVYFYALGPLWTSPDFACVDAHATAHPRVSLPRTDARHQRAPMRGQEGTVSEPEEEPRAADFDEADDRFSCKPPKDLKSKLRAKVTA